MTANSPAPPPSSGPAFEPGAKAAPSPRERPWWGPIDVLIAIFVWSAAVTAGTLVALLVTWLADFDLEANDDNLPVYALFVSMIVVTTAQFGWPWLVSRLKGLGLASDWGLQFRWPQDLGFGFLIAVICFLAALSAQQVTATLVGLDDFAEATNTGTLTDNDDSLWLIGIMAFVVFGAPLTEELFFRGLIMRSLLKGFGPAVAVIGSTVLFALPHISDGGSFDGQLVLWSAIAAIGLVLALAAIRFDRLGPAIIGHFFFNLVSAVSTLWS